MVNRVGLAAILAATIISGGCGEYKPLFEAEKQESQEPVTDRPTKKYRVLENNVVSLEFKDFNESYREYNSNGVYVTEVSDMAALTIQLGQDINFSNNTQFRTPLTIQRQDSRESFEISPEMISYLIIHSDGGLEISLKKNGGFPKLKTEACSYEERIRINTIFGRMVERTYSGDLLEKDPEFYIISPGFSRGISFSRGHTESIYILNENIEERIKQLLFEKVCHNFRISRLGVALFIFEQLKGTSSEEETRSKLKTLFENTKLTCHLDSYTSDFRGQGQHSRLRGRYKKPGFRQMAGVVLPVGHEYKEKEESCAGATINEFCKEWIDPPISPFDFEFARCINSYGLFK
ncbi:MAG: hypothetical protein ABH817_00425 [archaeon]